MKISPKQLDRCPRFIHGGRGWKGKRETEKNITTNRIDLILLNSNPTAEILASDQQEYYENYYTSGNADNGITNVHTYKTITYKNIYPNIDMVLHCKPSGMKYEFVVNPDGKVSDIQLQWNGLDGIKKLKDSGIEYSFALGKMDESKPVSFQGTEPINSAFIKNGNEVGFKVGNYDKAKQLIIDPSLVWGTYFGNDNNYGRAVIADHSGNVYFTGNTTDPSGISDSNDVFIAKFNSSGSRLWTIYYGKNYDNIGTGISLDSSGNIYITGWTGDSNGIATSGSYQTSYGGGGGDAFLAKFSNSGSLLWGTYYGGDGQDEGNGISIDGLGDIYITGFTNSASGIATSGAYQTSHSGATGLSNEAFLAKFSSSGSLLWGTYYAGIESWGSSVAADAFGNVCITGWTNSDVDVASAGAYQTIYGGAYNDAFLARFNSSGNLLWSTYYGGGNSDGGWNVSIDNLGYIYMSGNTTSDSGIATNGSYQASMGGVEDAFLAKFSSSGNLIWATYFGGSGTDEAFGLSIDPSGNVFISGFTSSTNNIATSDAYRTSNGGGDDAFLAKFNSYGNLTWATYYGGTGYDYAYGVSADVSGNIFIAGVTSSRNGIATPGAYQTSYGVGTDDAFLAKFNSRPPDNIGISGFAIPNDSVCAAQADPVIVKLKNYGFDTSISATIHWMVNGKIQDTVSWKGNILPDSVQLVNIGNYKFIKNNDTIVAWTSLDNTLDQQPDDDTSRVVVRFYSRHFAGAGQRNYAICTGTHIRIGSNGYSGNTYSWVSVPGGFSSTVPGPIVNPDSFTTFYLTETDLRTGCINTDSSAVIVKVLKAPVANPGLSQTICSGDSIIIGANPVPGLTYSWTSYPQGFTSTSSKATVSPDIGTTYYLTVTNANGCTDLGIVFVSVYYKPFVHVGISRIVCMGDLVKLGMQYDSFYSYSWTSNPKGFKSDSNVAVFNADSTRIYTLKLTNTYFDCSATASAKITVVPRPIVKILSDSLDAFNWKFSAINPNYSAYMYTWSINNSDTGTGYILSHAFLDKGRYDIALTVSDSGICTVTDSVIIYVNPQFSLNIFPNPFITNADIQYILDHPTYIKISVFDMLGKEISTLVDAQKGIGVYNTSFYAGTLHTKQAMYLIVFIMDDKIITKKIIQVGSIYY